MKKKKKRRFRAQNQQDWPPVSNQRPEEEPYPGHENESLSPNFSYLFDQTAREGQEYEVDPRQIRDDRQRRVEQITTEFPSLKEDEVFSYYERGGGLQEDSVANSEESLDYFPVRQNDDLYHTIPIFNSSGNPLSTQFQRDPDLSEMSVEEPAEEGQVDWEEDFSQGGDRPGLFETSLFRALEEDTNEAEGEAPLPLYDQSGTPGEGEEDEESGGQFEERFGIPYEQEMEEYEPEEWEDMADQGENAFDPVEYHPQQAVSPSGSFVMPSLSDEEEHDEFGSEDEDGSVLYSHSQSTQPFGRHDGEAPAVPVGSEDATELRVMPDKPGEGQPSFATQAAPEEEGSFRELPPEEEESSFTAPPAEEHPPQEEVLSMTEDATPDGGQASSFLRESPELVTFSSLEEDPRRNKPRISLLNGLTRYLNDDGADVSPIFYADDDYKDLDGEEMGDDYVSLEGLSGEDQNQPPLPSSLLFANVSQRPASQEEFNELKAHVFHSDLGFRKYYITIANLFDVISVERKFYVKHYPRQNRGAAQGNVSTAATARGPEEKAGVEREKKHGTAQKAGDGKRKLFSTNGEAADEGVEYERPEDVSKIRTELRRDIRLAQKSFYGSGLLALFSLFFTTAETLGITLPDFIRVSGGTTTFLIVNTLLLVGAILLNFDTIVESVRHLTALEFNSDLAVSLASIFCLLQNLFLLADVQKVAEGTLHIYSGLACLGLSLQAGGKLLMHKRVLQNFRFMASNKPKKVVRLVPDGEYTHQMAWESGEPIVAYQSRTQFLSGFMRLSYAIDPSEHTAQVLTPLLFLAGVLIGLITGIVQGNFLAGFTATAATVCASMPVACMLAINVPIYRLSKSLLRDGILLTSSASVDEYGEVNSIMLDASELFPAGSVVLHGVKKFGDLTVEEVMMEAAAVVCSVDGPLREMFVQSMGDTVDLSLVEGQVTYTDQLGFGGFMDGQPVFVGTADWIRRQGIALPPRDMVQKHTVKGRQILYFAKADQLVAFFTLTHVPEPTMMQAFTHYASTSGRLVICSTDPFVTERTISEWFHVDNRTVRVLSEEQGMHYRELLKGEEKRSPALLATTGRASSFLKSISACVRTKLNFTLVVALQAVSMVLGAVIVALFSIFADMAVLSAAAVLVFLLFWLGAILLPPFIRRI